MSTMVLKAPAEPGPKDPAVPASPPSPKKGTTNGANNGNATDEANGAAKAEKLAPSSPKREAADKKKRRGGRAGKSDTKKKDEKDGEKNGRRKSSDKSADEGGSSKSNFDCSSAISLICEGLWVSAVSGTRMGASLEATLLECGVTAVLSTIVEKNAGAPLETFQHHALDAQSDEDMLSVLHDCTDFINEAIQDGGVVFIHSRSGFSRSDWAVLIVIGYMIKYQSVKLQDAIESLSETTKHKISPVSKFRRELVQFEEEALGEASVDADWVEAADNAQEIKSHSLSRQKLAENLNDRRLLKKKRFTKLATIIQRK